MRDIYRGPAVLVGTTFEYEVHADLWEDVEEVNAMASDGIVVHTDGRRSWGGELTLSTADVAHDMDRGVLRLPDSSQGTVLVAGYTVAKDGDRLEVVGRGQAPGANSARARPA